MMIAGGILQEHPVASSVGQVVMLVVALISFYWAYHVTKPVSKRDANSRRQNATEAIVGLRALCNPGRRLTDRCAACPLDERCLKNLPPPPPPFPSHD